MSDQWLREWFPVVAGLLQVMLWSMALPRIVSPETYAIITFSQLPGNPRF